MKSLLCLSPFHIWPTPNLRICTAHRNKFNLRFQFNRFGSAKTCNAVNCCHLSTIISVASPKNNLPFAPFHIHQGSSGAFHLKLQLPHHLIATDMRHLIAVETNAAAALISNIPHWTIQSIWEALSVFVPVSFGTLRDSRMNAAAAM